jgi:hypothetical protein
VPLHYLYSQPMNTNKKMLLLFSSNLRHFIFKGENQEKELIMKRIFYGRHKWRKMRIMRNSNAMKCVLSLLWVYNDYISIFIR